MSYKIAVLIPDRKDRPRFLQNCLRMMQAQTLRPTHIEIVNDPPMSDKPDITFRYRTGYDRLRNKGFDVIAFIENDDWYHPEYLQHMVEQWELNGRPDLLGTQFTIYYHLKIRAHFIMEHPHRSAAMNTLIRPDMNFEWCVDHDPYTDLHLWMKQHRTGKLKGVLITPDRTLSIGMKHGEGKCGGRTHVDYLHKYYNGNNDADFRFLKATLDNESFIFYSSYYAN